MGNQIVKISRKSGKEIATCSSLQVAELLGIQNKRINFLIEKELSHKCCQSDDAIFIETKYKDKYEREQKMYLMDETGFMLITFNMTTQKAKEVKLAYIKKFSEMKALIIERNNQLWKEIRDTSKISRKELCDVIKPLADYVYSKTNSDVIRNATYSNYTKLVNKTIGTMIHQDKINRDYIPSNILFRVREIEDDFTAIISRGIYNHKKFHDIYNECKLRCHRILLFHNYDSCFDNDKEIKTLMMPKQLVLNFNEK